ncbi:MAG TPA: copper chaperone PCu(A)C [Candidatus Limnocylindrales bacterium]|jgi:copper(I)-binding protein|nr:copper chaperone PCu(A)C [Candidatus Limnocylindrales bacterium]
MQARAVAILTSLAVAILVAACGTGGSASAGASPTTVAGGPLVTRDAWVRAAAAGGTSAAYMTITNGRVAPDALVGVSAPDVTDSAGLHETSSDSSGMTGMKPVDSIAIPAGGTVALEPGGYHIMLMDLKQELKVGDRVTLVLSFEQAGVVNVTAEVRAN